MNYRPHPFSWCPAHEHRHATKAAKWHDGEQVTTLCGASVTAADTVLAWLWPTCERCDVHAHELAGVPMPPKPRTSAKPVRRRSAGAR
ncbi:zinc finger protein [Saccharopolyspora cebuensis]|uniref:Zinc finger protein n=1 Tax=Saccharopolyspora cebuensis TaxID=418759 RepID=A0ABV4CJD6_9PSEU